MAVIDPLQAIITLLSGNWIAANTDSVTPTFSKITDQKALDFHGNVDQVMIHRSRPDQEPAGVGASLKHKHFLIDIDIRVFADQYGSIADGETHWLKVIDEVDRILDSKIVLPNADFQILDPDEDTRQDLSDRTHQVFRYMITVRLSKYAVART